MKNHLLAWGVEGGGGDKYFRKIEKTQDKNAIFYIKIDPDDSTPASTSFGYVINDWDIDSKNGKIGDKSAWHYLKGTSCNWFVTALH